MGHNKTIQAIVYFLLLSMFSACNLPGLADPLAYLLINQVSRNANPSSGNSNASDDSNNRVATPIFSPSAGHYTTPQNIVISTTTENATLYYSLDGSDPTTSSAVYTGPIHIWGIAGKTLKAFATREGLQESAIASSGIYSYPVIRTGQTATLAPQDDGALSPGVVRSYSGPTQHTVYPSDYTTTDNATGLVWRTCSQGQTGDTCPEVSIQMTYANSQTGTDGCNSLNSMNAGNGYAGRTDWRLPTRFEMETLHDYGLTAAPTISGTFFPNTPTDRDYFTSNVNATNTTQQWLKTFFFGGQSIYVNVGSRHVRCVSGISRTYNNNFRDNGDGTISDRTTGLVWQKCSIGQTGTTCSDTAASLLNWNDAILNCNSQTLAARTWRLPTLNELRTLMDILKATNPRIDETYFPSTEENTYWSSTSNSSPTTIAWRVNFTNTAIDRIAKTNTFPVRCVSDP
ncbi:MAG: DUF1566 domain-containing protein [Leptospira sp.]|nr:DUF1566 domain-containing protein [Leptospira sp.]